MTAKKKVTKPKEKTERRTKGGLKDKIAWVDAQFVEKEKSRADAVHGLLKKYPDMALNYARAIVYSYMKEFTFAKAERKSKSPATKKTTAQKAAATKAKNKAAAAKKPASKASAKKNTSKAPSKKKDDYDVF